MCLRKPGLHILVVVKLPINPDDLSVGRDLVALQRVCGSSSRSSSRTAPAPTYPSPCWPQLSPPPLPSAGRQHAGPQAHLRLVRAQRPAPTRGARRSPAPQHAQRGVPPAAAGAAVRVDELVFHDGGGAPIMGDGDAPVWARDARRPLRRRRWTSSEGGGEGGGGGGGGALDGDQDPHPL